MRMIIIIITDIRIIDEKRKRNNKNSDYNNVEIINDTNNVEIINDTNNDESSQANNSIHIENSVDFT